jgi:predicted transcriptional regulator
MLTWHQTLGLNEKSRQERNEAMRTTKEHVIELVKAMPDNVTVDEVIEELYFKLQVDQGLAELDRGESIPHEEVERRLAKWLSQ